MKRVKTYDRNNVKIYIILIILLLSVSLKAQFDTNCCPSNDKYNISLSTDFSMSKNILLPSVSLNASYEVNKFEFGTGIGYVFDSKDVTASWIEEAKAYVVVLSYNYDSTYYIGDQTYHVTTKVDVYDSVAAGTVKTAMTTYRYIKIPIYVTYDLYKLDRISIGGSFKSDLYIESSKNTDSYSIDREDFVPNPERHDIFIFSSLTLIIEFGFTFGDEYPKTNNAIVNDMYLFINPHISYQHVKFQEKYSSFYYGISLGVKIPIN